MVHCKFIVFWVSVLLKRNSLLKIEFSIVIFLFIRAFSAVAPSDLPQVSWLYKKLPSQRFFSYSEIIWDEVFTFYFCFFCQGTREYLPKTASKIKRDINFDKCSLEQSQDTVSTAVTETTAAVLTFATQRKRFANVHLAGLFDQTNRKIRIGLILIVYRIRKKWR